MIRYMEGGPVRAVQPCGPTRLPVIHCTLKGCANPTKDGKPFCTRHVAHMPYVKDLLQRMSPDRKSEPRPRSASPPPIRPARPAPPSAGGDDPLAALRLAVLVAARRVSRSSDPAALETLDRAVRSLRSAQRARRAS